MARVFVSHATEDAPQAAELHTWLIEQGHEAFLDRDLLDGIQLGEEWEQRLYERLRWADAMVCLVTSRYVKSFWCMAEVVIARSRGSRVLPLQLEHGVSHELLRSTQWVDLASDPIAARAALSRALRQVDAAGGMGWPDGRSPFPGLRAFDADMRRVFFGRGADVEALAALLRAPGTMADRQLVVVVGPTGCGKSSLVRAGLVPTMAEEDAWWTIAPFFPGLDPVGALAAELAAAARQLGQGWTVEEVSRRLEGEGGLRSVARELLLAASHRGRRRRHLLVVVDQLEELLRRTSPAARSQFAGLVAPAIAGPVHVVATLQPEYLADLQSSLELEALAVRTFSLRPLRREALRSVIEEPARVAGIGIDEALVSRLVADAETGEALPLLAFTLSQLAEGVGRGGRLSVRHYENLGGIGGALRQQAEAALEDARAASGRASDEVIAGLLQLVTVDENGQPTRWRMSRAELPTPVLIEMNAFIERRLVTTDTDESGAALIGVAHESFLSAWPPLAEAIARAASALRMRRTVEQAAADWERANRARRRLWTSDQLAASRAELGARLRPASLTGWLGRRQRVLATQHVGLSARARDFIVASMRRERWRRTRVTTILSGALVLVLALASFAFVQQREAVNQQRIATARELTAEANDLRDSRPDVSLMLSVESQRVAASSDARASLLTTLVQSHYAGTLSGHSGPVNALAYSPNGYTLATAGVDGTAILWGLGDRARPVRLATLNGGAGSVHGVAYGLPEGRTLAIAGDDGTATVWDVGDRTNPVRVATLSGHTASVYGVTFSPDGRTLATASADGTAMLWDVGNRAHPDRLATLIGHSGQVYAVTYSPDGRTLATASTDQTAMLWDVHDRAHPVRLATLSGHTDTVYGVAFSPDGRTLATASRDGTAILWDVDNRTRPARLATLTGHTDWVWGVAYSPDGRTVTTASADHTAILWDVSDRTRPARLATLSGHAGEVLGVTYSPDGHTLATAGADRTAVVWNVGDWSHPARLATLSDQTGELLGAAFNTDNRTLVTASADRTTIVWDVRDRARPVRLTTLNGQASPVYAMAYSPDGRTLATASDDRTVRLWDVGDRARPVRLAVVAQTDTVLSVAFSPDGRTLATASTDRTVVLWDVGERTHPTRLATVLGHAGAVYGVTYGPDGQTLATASADGMAILWYVGERTHPVRLATLRGHTGSVYGVAYAPDGRTLATAGADRTAILWDVSERARPVRLATLSGHTGPVYGVAYGPDGRTLATAGADRRAILWDVGDRTHPTRLATLSGHTDEVLGVAYSPDGRTLATTSRDRTAILWDVGETTSVAAHAVDLACAMAGPGLSRTDWARYIPGMPYERICP